MPAKAKLSDINPFLLYNHARYLTLTCTGGENLVQL